MYLRALEICVLKYMSLISFNTWISVASSFKKDKVKLDLLSNIDMLLMVENVIIGGICHSIYQYAKANNIYMKNYDKNNESSYLKCWDVNDLCGWAMPQKLPVNNFEWIKDTSQFTEDFIKKTTTKKLIKDIF